MELDSIYTTDDDWESITESLAHTNTSRESLYEDFEFACYLERKEIFCDEQKEFLEIMFQFKKRDCSLCCKIIKKNKLIGYEADLCKNEKCDTLLCYSCIRRLTKMNPEKMTEDNFLCPYCKTNFD